MVQTAIKRGPMLRHIDARMITNPRYQRYALDLAEKLGIPVQDAVRSAGATNGAAIHLTEKSGSGYRYRSSGSLCTYTLRNFSLCRF